LNKPPGLVLRRPVLRGSLLRVPANRRRAGLGVGPTRDRRVVGAFIGGD
jgi:hypothetical protein